MLRNLRGMIGIGLTWAILWAAFIAVVVAIARDRSDVGPFRAAAIFGMVGLVSGFGFALLLSVAERGKAAAGVSLFRAAAWGVLGAALFPLLTGREDQAIFTCTLGAILAIALVASARRGQGRAFALVRDTVGR
jgi:hypothetical protein